MRTINPPLRRLTATLTAALALGMGAGLAQAQTEGRQPPSLSERTGEALSKLTPLINEKKWDEIFTLLNSIPNVGPTSYDKVMILDISSKIFLQKDDYAGAIGPMEEALKIADEQGYWDETTTLNTLYLLSQLIYSEASVIKDKAQQAAQVAKAAGYLGRWQKLNPKPTPDSTMFYAQILYAQATANPEQINQAVLKQASDVLDAGMRQAIHPKDGFYQLKLALLQQANDYQGAAELLELMVKKFPDKKDLWQFLMQCYLQLGNDKDPAKAREAYVRAINAVERAQAMGLMKDEKDNDNLVKVYLLSGQFNQGTKLLHAGLRSGGIENTLANWRLLGSYYQQADKPLDAIAALEEAAKLYPREGMLNLQIGELHRGLNRSQEALNNYRIALQKGNLEKGPRMTLQLAAFAATDIDDFEAAHGFITEAAKDPEFASDRQMVSFKNYIEETVNDRREAAKEKAERAKNASALPKM